MDLAKAHTCKFCEGLTIDLDKGRLDVVTSAGVRQGVLFDTTLRNILSAEAGGCMLFKMVVQCWVGWDASVLETLRDRQDELVLFWAVDFNFRRENEEHRDCDISWIEGMCLWDTKSKAKVDMAMGLACHVLTPADDAASEAVQSRPISRHPGSAETFGIMRNFLDDCMKQIGDHAQCGHSAQTSVPSRLLRIKSCRIKRYRVEIWHADSIVPYAALSYCWGGDQAHKTTSARLAAGELELEWCLLPKTIRDAIETTAQLQIEYLWVDSLCIVQDDGDDKMREIARMPEIYSDAVITIIAARPKTAKDGFLQEIGLLDTPATMFQLPFRCPDGVEGHVYLVRQDTFLRIEHIDTRAWTLQESYLSKRLLKYGTNQCSMICQHSPLRPQVVDGWKIGSFTDTVPLLANMIFPTSILSLTKEDEAAWKKLYLDTFGVEMQDLPVYETEQGDFIDLWVHLIEDYTSRALTVSSDRPLAISGLAARIAPVMGNEYRAGHWVQYLPLDLLWYVPYPIAGPEEYQAPSWSWTSVNGPIVFSTRVPLISLDGVSLEILNVEAPLVDPVAPFGAVTTGTIHARGRLLRILWTGDEAVTVERNTVLFSTRSCTSRKRQVSPDSPDSSFLQRHPQVTPISSGSPERNIPGGVTNEYSKFFVLHLLEVCSTGSVAGFDFNGPMGLVLQQVQTGETPRFVRIGHFDFASNSSDPSPRPDLISTDELLAMSRDQERCFDGCELTELIIE